MTLVRSLRGAPKAVLECAAESLAVPATLLDEIAKAPAAWAELRAELESSLHVDMLRLMLPTH